MRSILVVATLAVQIVLLLISSCATVPREPLGKGELRLLSLHVPGWESIKVDSAYVANVAFEADGKPEIKRACFYWSDDGPYCFGIGENFGSSGTIEVQLRTKNPGVYTLECYVLYVRDGKIQPTNVVSAKIRVKGSLW